MDYPRFNPFPGLRSFEADEDHLFFGRERRIDELLGRLRSTRFLAVVGTSGSGKSSLVRSGLIPSLYSGFMTKAGSAWRLAVFRPGDDPIGNLAESLNDPEVIGMEGDFTDTNRSLIEATLRRSSLGLSQAVKSANVPEDENVLVLVDQFEELFRFKRNDRIKGSVNDAVAFVNLLLEASIQEDVPIYIVLTMRSDFIGNFTEFRGLAEAVNDGQYLVPRMTREERRAAIVGPVAVGGGEISPRLVLRLLNDVGDNPDHLPIMQHALMRTWDYWENHHTKDEPMDLRHYEAIGSTKGALSKHAEEAFHELDETGEKRIAEFMFKALADKALGNPGVRAPRRLSELCEFTGAQTDEVIRVIDRFRATGRCFLMPPVDTDLNEDSIIDISHESLMRVWIRLIKWVDQEASSAQVYLRISKAAAQYQEGSVGVFRDPELQLAINWRQENTPNAAWAERYDVAFDRSMVFLEHSETVRDQEAAEKERQRKRQLQWARRLAVVLGSAAILTLIFGLYAMTLKIVAEENEIEALLQKDIAHQQREEAEKQRKVADEERANAEVAREVADEQKDVAEQQKKVADIQRERAQHSEGEALLQKGQAVAAREVAVDEREKADLAREEAEEQRSIAVTQKRVADTEREKAEISEKEAQRLRGLAVAKELAIKTSLLVQDDQHELAALLALQAYRLNTSNNGVVSDPEIFEALHSTLVRLKPDQEIILRHHHDTIRSLAAKPLSESSRDVVASGSDDGTVQLIDLTDVTAPPRVLGSTNCEVMTVAWSADGKQLAAGSFDGLIRVWPAKGGEPTILEGNGQPTTALAFSRDSQTIVSGTLDGEVRIREISLNNSGKILLPAGARRAESIVFTRDGALLVAVRDKGIFLLDLNDLDLNNETSKAQLIVEDVKASCLAVSRDGTIAAGTKDGPILVWLKDLSTIPQKFQGHSSAVTALSFGSESRRLASASLDGSVRLWDVKEPDSKPIKISGHQGWVRAVVFAADGKRVISGGADRTMRIWQIDSQPFIDAICQHVTRDLSPVEWAEFLPSDIKQEATCPRN